MGARSRYESVTRRLRVVAVLRIETRYAVTGATRDAVERQATLVLEQRFANDSFVLRALCLKSLNRGDGAVQAQVDWRTRSNFTVRLVIERFYGDPNGIFGEFREASRARVNVEFAL